MKRILFTGGGSAGHVVPNLAIMREIKYSYEISYMGGGGIETKLVGKAGFPFFRVDSPKLIRDFSAENLRIPFRLQRAKREALKVIEAKKFDLVFSKGGFQSYPAVWAAHRLKIPVLTHESDLSPGLCTKLIARKCKYVLTSFPETAERFPNGKFVGSPIRREVFSGDKMRARQKYSVPSGLPVLLVFGGGSGSRTLNEAVGHALTALNRRFFVLHITGGEEKGRTERYLPLPFEPDMGSAYAAADVVLSRAGSNTVFELLALKKKAILVPLEQGSRGDQLENAAYFAKKGLFFLLPEARLGELPIAAEEVLRDRAIEEALAASDFRSGTEAIVGLIKEILS